MSDSSSPHPRPREFIHSAAQSQQYQQQLPSPCQGDSSLHRHLSIHCLAPITASGKGWMIFGQAAGATVPAWEVGSLSASACLQTSSQHFPQSSVAAGWACSVSWSWHRGSVAVAPQRDQAASRTQSASGQREFKLSRRKSLSSRHCIALEIAALSGRCQLGMEISCGGHGVGWGRDITGLLGNYLLAVPRMKGCDCCF